MPTKKKKKKKASKLEIINRMYSLIHRHGQVIFYFDSNIGYDYPRRRLIKKNGYCKVNYCTYDPKDYDEPEYSEPQFKSKTFSHCCFLEYLKRGKNLRDTLKAMVDHDYDYLQPIKYQFGKKFCKTKRW